MYGYSTFNWSQQLSVLRESIQALSSGVERLQRPADAWLQQFAASPGSWRLCLRLLEAPGLHLNECFYAANHLRTVCLKHQDVLEVSTLNELLPKLAYHLQTCLHRQQWAPANQLAAAIASLAARSPSMQPDALPQAICSSFSPAVAQALGDASNATATAATTAAAAATAAATGPQQQASPLDQHTPTQSQWGYSGWHSNLGVQTDPATAAAVAAAAAAASARSQEVLQMCLQQEPLVLAALLQVLAALPETLTSRQVLWYTFDRREAVKAGLLSAHGTTLVVAAALCSQNPRLVMLSCDALVGLCELGSVPVGLEVQTGALQVLTGAVLSNITCSKAAEGLAALASTCKGCLVTGMKWQLLQQILLHLQQTVFPALTTQHEGMPASRRSSTGTGSATPLTTAAPPGAASVTETSYIQVVGAQYGVPAQAAFARLMCILGSALLTPILQGAKVPEGTLDDLLQQLLLGMESEDDGVAMHCVGFWQDDFVVQVQALSATQKAAAMQQLEAKLEALVAALVQRTELTPAALATATADARDLPEEMRLMRRELAAAIRDVGKLAGHETVLAYMVKLVQGQHEEMKKLIREAGGPVDATPATLGVDTMAACCKLEGGLYSANVVLGRLFDVCTPEVDAMVEQMLGYAADMATNHTKIHKLAGTALTLMGGLPQWLVRHTEHLPAVLTAAAMSLRSPDDKLARNAATCMQRLTSKEDLAALLFALQPAHVQELLQEYQRRGGLPVTLLPSVGDDQSTEELLLLALCSIAVAHSSSSNSVADINSILLQLVGPQLREASDELAAALQGNWDLQVPSAPETPMLAQTLSKQQKRRGVLQPRVLGAVLSTSKAVVCFEAMAKLVAGLPTGTHKYTIGVPMHTKHPRHQRMVDEVSQMLGLGVGPPVPLGVVGQPPPPPLPLQQQRSQAQSAGAALEPASVDDSDEDSEPSSPGGSSVQERSNSGASVLTKALHVGQGRQMPHIPLARQQHACLFVSQLVLQASESVTLALQAAAAAMANPQSTRFGSDLLAGVSNFLQCALPAALHYRMMTTGRGGSSSTGGSAQGEGAGGYAGAAGDAEAGASGPVLQTTTLLLQLCQLMEGLPVELLQQSGSLQLLLIAVTCAALEGALPEDECLDLEALREPQQPLAHPPDRMQAQLLMLLQRLVSLGLTAACQSIIAQQGGADEDHAAAALSLASVCVQRCPAVLVSVDMGLLLSMTLVACKTYHLKQVTALLDWVETAVYGAYAQLQPVWTASGGSNLTLVESGASTRGAGFGRNLLSAMRARLEAGMGVQLVLALMMAASGHMPSDVVLPVSLCLHAIWLSVGPQLFQVWLHAVVLQLAPESAQWARARPPLKTQFLQTLTEPSCLTDVTKFKGILKSFCGRKKKGPIHY